jgi:hypothetical protein
MLVRHAHFRAPLFGTFPLPPTIPGVVGQRVFGGEERRQDPADGLHRVLAQLMAQKAPRLSEVKTECDGLDARELDELAGRIRSMFGTGAMTNGRSDPWRVTRTQLMKLRSQATQS